jgi:hypothetical protein
MAEQPDGDRPSSANPNNAEKRAISSLTNGQRRAARMIALGRKIAEVARALRVGPRVLFEWRKHPEFAAEVERWHREQEDAVRSALFDSFEPMLDVLKGEATNVEAASMERTVAAKGVIDAVMKIYLGSKAALAKVKEATDSAEDRAEAIRDAMREADALIDPDAK